MPQRSRDLPEGLPVSADKNLGASKGSHPFCWRRLILRSGDQQEIYEIDDTNEAMKSASLGANSDSDVVTETENDEVERMGGEVERSRNVYKMKALNEGRDQEVFTQSNSFRDIIDLDPTELFRATINRTNVDDNERMSISQDENCGKIRLMRKYLTSEQGREMPDWGVDQTSSGKCEKSNRPRKSFTRNHKHKTCHERSSQSNEFTTANCDCHKKNNLKLHEAFDQLRPDKHSIQRKAIQAAVKHCIASGLMKVRDPKRETLRVKTDNMASDSQIQSILGQMFHLQGLSQMDKADDTNKHDDARVLKENLAQSTDPLTRSSQCNATSAPLKTNVNTNAHGDQNVQPTIITHNKPTHGSQKFLVRKDKQWNNGDGCEPSYIIHIESRTDQSSVCSKPLPETRRRRGDIVRMKRMELSSVKSSTSSNVKIYTEETEKISTSNCKKEAKERFDDHQNKSDVLDSTNNHAQKKKQSPDIDDHRLAHRGKLRLIDHLEKKELSPDENKKSHSQQTEQRWEKNDGWTSTCQRVSKIPVVFKETVTWLQKQNSKDNVCDAKHSAQLVSDECHGKQPEKDKTDTIQLKFRVAMDDGGVAKNKEENRNLNKCFSQTHAFNASSQEKRKKSPLTVRRMPSRQESAQVERTDHTYKHVIIPWEVINCSTKYDDLMPYFQVRHSRDVACQCSPPAESVSLKSEISQSSKDQHKKCHSESKFRQDISISSSATASKGENKLTESVQPIKLNHQPSSTVKSFHYSCSTSTDSQSSKRSKPKHATVNNSNSAQKKSMIKKLSYMKKNKRRSHSEQSSLPYDSSDSNVYDFEVNNIDSPLPLWSGQNYNPNANFSSCEISPCITPSRGNHATALPMRSRGSFCSLSEQEIGSVINPKLNENHSNQKSYYSSEAEREEKNIVLEPITPSILYRPPPKDEPSPRYSAPMSLEKLQKLIEEAKAHSRASVKILDQNTNFDNECDFQDREAQDVSNTFIGEYLYKLWKNECLCDVKVTVEEVDFFVHKLVLAAFSNVFCPSTPQPPPSVCFNVPCSTPDAVNQIFNYIYTSCMELKDDLLEPILSAALFMGISEVVEIINEILMKPTLDNVEAYIKIRKRHTMYCCLADFPSLYQNHFMELINHEVFLDLTVAEFETILRDPDVLVTSELDTISGIANWVKYNAVERASSLSRLLRCVSFESISPKLLASIAEEYHYLFTLPGAPQVISEAFKFHALKLETQCGGIIPPTSPCKPMKKNCKDRGMKKHAQIPKQRKKDHLRKYIYYSPTPAQTECPCDSFSLDPKSVSQTDMDVHRKTSLNFNASASQLREFNSNTARLDVHPSNYFRNLPSDASVINHHGYPKQKTPIVSAQAAPNLHVTATGKPNDNNKRQHPGKVWHSNLNGERQLWQCSDILLAGSDRRTEGHGRIVSIGRPTSRLGKKKSLRHRYHHGFNNNAADYALLVQGHLADQLCSNQTKSVHAEHGVVAMDSKASGDAGLCFLGGGKGVSVQTFCHHFMNPTQHIKEAAVNDQKSQEKSSGIQKSDSLETSFTEE